MIKVALHHGRTRQVRFLGRALPLILGVRFKELEMEYRSSEEEIAEFEKNKAIWARGDSVLTDEEADRINRMDISQEDSDQYYVFPFGLKKHRVA